MHIDVLQLDETDCLPFEHFYFCGANKFRGCCLTDPCNLPSGCPIHLETPSSETSQTFTFTDLEDFPTISEEIPSPTPFLVSGSTLPSTMAPETQPSKPDDGRLLTSTIKSRTLTDSGRTRTIPNSSTVTVTKKTLIFTDEVPTETPEPSFVSSPQSTPTTFATSTIGASPVATSAPGVADNRGPSLSTGAIVGAAVGGAVLLAIVSAFVFKLFRHRRELNRSHSDATSYGGAGRYSEGEKQGMSAQHTGESDPFAEFGGRVDKPPDPYAPKAGAFEMDATSTAPVELPAEAIGSHPTPRTEPAPVPVAGPPDPRANLNASLTDRSQNTYVNHWNQYRNLG